MDMAFTFGCLFCSNFFSCIFTMLKHTRSLKKYEKEFAKELMELSAIDRQEYLENSKVANQIFLSKSKTI